MLKYIALVCVFAFYGTLHGAIDVEKVYVVCSANDATSSNIAKEYCRMRGISTANIISLDCPKSGTVSRSDYFDRIETPLLRALVEKKALVGEFLQKNESGRRAEFAYISHNTDFIVLCRGVPWAIVASEGRAQQHSGKFSASTDAASVDSELSAVFLGQKSCDGFVRNPLYGNLKNPDIFKSAGVLRVARIDGISERGVLNAVRSAIAAENCGARGRVYIDKCGRDKNADKWLDTAAAIFDEMGFDISSDSKRELFGFGSRMDGCLFYFGWYSTITEGFFSEPDFSLVDGSVALHIFSFSAQDMRRPRMWTPSFVERGCASTFGNVFEPFLGMTHHPHIVAAGLASGLSAGETAYAAVPVLGWQNVFVGDPLYSPFRKKLDSQLADIDGGIVDELSQYSVIRAMNLLERKVGAGEAEKFGRAYLGRIPDTALIWKLALLSQKKGDQREFERLCAILLAKVELTSLPAYRGLAMEIASKIADTNAKSAMKIYAEISERKLSADFRKFLASQAKSLSEKSGLLLPEKIVDLKKSPTAKK